MKKKVLILVIILFCGIMSSNIEAKLNCGGILVSCGTAAGCWDDEMSLEEYRDFALLVDSYACP